MSATLKKYVSDKLLIINYAVYQAHVIEKNGELIYREHPLGMWDMDRYITLLMGEIPRLRDDQNGYGPQGKNFISHVNIPQDVECAFEMLKHAYADYVREADSRYASEKKMPFAPSAAALRQKSLSFLVSRFTAYP